MKKRKIKYTDEPIGKIKIIPNFLPPPDKLILREDTVKVTLHLSRFSVNFLKEVAKKNHTQYQKMIRKLLDEYVRSYEEKD